MVGAASPVPSLTGVRSAGAVRHLGSRFPRFRALGPGAKRGPHADLPQREGKSAAPVSSSAGSGAALAILSLRSPDLKLHMHAAMDALRALRAGEERGRRAAIPMTVPNPALRGVGGLRSPVKFPDAVGLRAMLSKTQIVRHRFMILRACSV